MQRAFLSQIIIVGVAGCCGAVSSFLLTRALFAGGSHPIPMATLCINVLGSFLLGFVYFSLEASTRISPAAKQDVTLFIFSFTGAFTSLSAFALESFLFAHSGRHISLVFNMLANVCLTIACVFLGKLAVSAVGNPLFGLAQQTAGGVRGSVEALVGALRGSEL